MAITAKKGDSFTKELVPQGNHVARCVKMIELGTIPGEYMGQAKMFHKVRIGWELPLELRVFKEENGEQPMMIEKEYTLSLAENAHLRKDLKSWRGKDFTEAEAEAFDITKLLGVPCMLNVIHVQGKNDPTKTYQQIAGVTPLPKGFICPDQINPSFVFELENFNKEKFDSLPEFIRDTIVKSEEYNALHSSPSIAQQNAPFPLADNNDSEEQHDDLPF